MNLQKHIWEGWTPQDFINELDPILNMVQNNQSWEKPMVSKKELKVWCMYNQPYYKKYVPEVVNYFSKNITYHECINFYYT